MTARGKSINLFLMDGDPSGRIKSTLANWTGVAYKLPRTELEKCEGREDLLQSGVYFLFGISDQTGENVAYIGQAGVRKNRKGILYRLQEHKRDAEKDYWTEAVVFTTSNNSFGPTEISYLENRFTNLANSANRYLIKNSNEPTLGNVTEEKESELEEFIEYAKIIMGALGYKVFESLVKQVTALSSEDSDVALAKPEQVFFIKRSGANATARLTNEGLVVLSGSIIRKDILPSCPHFAKLAREDNKNYIEVNGLLTKDILFKTPSGASAFVLGASTNGNVEWKKEDGKTLKEVEASEVKD
ncbi:GIY-YIG nuclease family protein [Paenibacillus albicereus]|uniref:GIY-YIG nuclease family protein n=1 Tax=Paenibacillus albicereus TaxID=2726185 RepID=A0A6H2H2W7_9BACL|nr:GIY-YIG nuclease family protein [Paenibacillus albicereus]QJC54043.1 GIY-YIG nuclease family protein [Paenibacillus albicereus]